MVTFAPMTGLDKGKNERRLESWKEIAGFFNRDEKTVRRWEKDLGLPVHRLPGVSKGRVYAFAQELSEWSEKPRTLQAEGASESDPELVVSPVAPVAPPEVSPLKPPARAYGFVFYFAAVAGVLLLGLVGAAFRTNAGGFHYPRLDSLPRLRARIFHFIGPIPRPNASTSRAVTTGIREPRRA